MESAEFGMGGSRGSRNKAGYRVWVPEVWGVRSFRNSLRSGVSGNQVRLGQIQRGCWWVGDPVLTGHFPTPAQGWGRLTAAQP